MQCRRNICFLCFTRTGRKRMLLVSTNHDRHGENLVTCALICDRKWGSNLSVSPSATEVWFFEVYIQKKVQSHSSQPHFSQPHDQTGTLTRKQESTLPFVLHSLLTSWIVVTHDCCRFWSPFMRWLASNLVTKARLPLSLSVPLWRGKLTDRNQLCVHDRI